MKLKKWKQSTSVLEHNYRFGSSIMCGRSSLDLDLGGRIDYIDMGIARDH